MSLTSYRAAPPRVRGEAPGLTRGVCVGWAGGPGGDLLSRALRHSTMGAGGFHGRVRDGIGCGPPAMTTRSSNPPVSPGLDPGAGVDHGSGVCVVCAKAASPGFALGMISVH